MFSVSHYFSVNQQAIAKQMAHLVSETKTRLPATLALLVLAGFFINMWGFIAVLLVLMALDDLVLYVLVKFMTGPHALKAYLAIILSNTFVVALFALPFGLMIFDPSSYVSLAVGIMCLLIAYVQTATQRTMDLFHGLVTSLPLMIVLIMALIGLVFTQHSSTVLIVVGLLTLVIAATYMFWMFLDNARLRYSLEKETQRANQANLAKTEFLATMSHEIRTPLNGVLGAVQMLQESNELQRDRWRFDVLLRSVDNLKHIVDDAIDVSRVESGKFAIKYEPTDLPKMLDDIRFLFDSAAKEKGLALNLHIDDGLRGRHLVAGGRIRQIVINLTSNAVKYTDSGQISIHLAEKNGEVVISVRDTGPGITDAERAELFDRFSRLTSARNSKTEGAGLGLAISKELAEAMGGRIDLHSIPGQGSQFILTIPAQRTEADDTGDTAEHVDADALFSGRTILVVDDNDINRTIAREFLRNDGADVIEAEHGQAALDILDQRKVDMILLDQRMPVMDGPAMLTHLRSCDCPNRDVMVVVLTAGVSDEPLDAFRGLNVAAFLSKPILKGDLLKAMAEHLPLDHASPSPSEPQTGEGAIRSA